DRTPATLMFSLSLHDALPISDCGSSPGLWLGLAPIDHPLIPAGRTQDQVLALLADMLPAVLFGHSTGRTGRSDRAPGVDVYSLAHIAEDPVEAYNTHLTRLIPRTA